MSRMPPKPSSSQKKPGGKLVLKKSLQEPYQLSWPSLPKGVNSFILKELSEYFKQHPEEKRVKSAGKRKRKQEARGPLPTSSSEAHVFTGINIVTKKLERGELDLVLVCKSAKPALLTQHLIPLSASRSTPAACVAGLSEKLSTELNLKSVLAVGVSVVESTENSELDKVVRNIKEKVPVIEVPWLQEVHLVEDSGIRALEHGQDSSVSGVNSRSSSDHNHSFLPTRVCVNKSVFGTKKKRGEN